MLFGPLVALSPTSFIGMGMASVSAIIASAIFVPVGVLIVAAIFYVLRGFLNMQASRLENYLAFNVHLTVVFIPLGFTSVLPPMISASVGLLASAWYLHSFYQTFRPKLVTFLILVSLCMAPLLITSACSFFAANSMWSMMGPGGFDKQKLEEMIRRGQEMKRDSQEELPAPAPKPELPAPRPLQDNET